MYRRDRLMENAALFLDDLRFPCDISVRLPGATVVIARSYTEFINLITEYGLPLFVSYDHDINSFVDGREYTGADCARWLANYCIDNKLNIPDYQVHSANPEGASNIVSILESARKVMMQ
jgi:hypothetical protein